MGAVTAYAVNILMAQYERWYFPRSQSRAVLRTRRLVCLLLAYASLVAIVVLLVRMILPELISCVGLLIQKSLPFLEQLGLLIGENLTQEQLAHLSGLFLADGSIDWQETISVAADWLINGLGGVMGSVISMVSATVSSAFTAIMAFIFSIYLLLGKEKLTRNVALVARTLSQARLVRAAGLLLGHPQRLLPQIHRGPVHRGGHPGPAVRAGHDPVPLPLRLHDRGPHRLHRPDPGGGRLYRRRGGGLHDLHRLPP